MYEDKTFEAILTEAKKEAGTGVQMGEGYLLYNALAALSYEIQKLYIQLNYLYEQSHADTADLDELVKIAKDRGIYRKTATSAYVSVKANCKLPIGSRFSLKSYHYRVIEAINANLYTYKATCEETGSGANNLTGELTAIDYVDGLEKAEIAEVLINGTDDETRDALYARYLQSFTTESFGGNIAQYKEKVNSFSGVGGCRVMPVWNGPGTVKVVVLSSEGRACSSYLVEEIQTAAVPEKGTGYGFAPIDHDVLIATVRESSVNVSAGIVYADDYNYSKVKEELEVAVSGYLKTLVAAWPSGDSSQNTTVYLSKIQAAMLEVDGVMDITSTMINGKNENMVLEWDQIPVLGEVITV